MGLDICLIFAHILYDFEFRTKYNQNICLEDILNIDSYLHVISFEDGLNQVTAII